MDTNELMNEWFSEDTNIDSVSMAEFDKYVEEYCQVVDAGKELENRLTEVNKRITKMQAKLIEYLEAQGKTSHISRVGRLTCVTRESWKAPEGEGRDEVVTYLKEHGHIDAVMAFNAAKFSSWFKQEKESNPSFDLKGVEQKVIKYITVK